MLSSYLQGFAIGFSLILAIGAQNAFVLKQGLKQQHIFWICLLCALSDATLIALGVFGFAALMQQFPMMITIARYAGALFLMVYGAQHIKQALQANQSIQLDAQSEQSLWKILGICLALTWLNPHVYLDTVVLLGSISTQFAQMKLYFALGAISASFLFFFALGYGARLLLPVFKNPKAWQVLDVMIAVVMWSIALSLVFTLGLLRKLI